MVRSETEGKAKPVGSGTYEGCHLDASFLKYTGHDYL